MSVTVAVAGEPITIERGSLVIEALLDEPSTASFVVLDDDLTRTFQRGQPVAIADDGGDVFRGWVARASTLELAGVAARHTLECLDHHYLADKRIVARVWESTTAGAIVRDIIDDWLADEGVTAGEIDDGPPVTRWAAQYEPASQVIEDLAEQANCHWRVDGDRQLHFHGRDKTAAPWALHPDLDGWPERGATLERGNDRYRNVQYVVGGRDETEPQTETFAGDGQRRTFNVAFPVKDRPTVKVNDVEQTVGVRGIDDDSSADWFFAHRSTEISQHHQATPLSPSDELEVVYTGLFEAVARTHHGPEIDERQTVEGGDTSGQVEAVHVDQRLESRAEMFEVAAGRLERFARVGRILSFVTLRAGLATGQLLTVSYPPYGLDQAEMLITSVMVTEGGPGQMQWDIKAAEGPAQGSWVAWFRGVQRRDALQTLQNISEEQVLVVLEQVAADWGWAEQVTITPQACALLPQDLPMELC